MMEGRTIGFSTRGAVLAATLLGLLLRLWGLGRQSIWVDEHITLKFAGFERPLTADALIVNLQGPFHALLLNLFCGLFGWGEFAARLPQAIVSAATVPLLYAVARRPFGERTALLGAFLLAVNPFHIWYAQEIRNYALMIFFVVLSLGAVLRLEAAGRPRSSILPLAAVWTGGLLSNLGFFFQMVASGLWGLIRFRRRGPALATLFLAGGFTLIATLPWTAQFYQKKVSPSHLLRLEAVPSSERVRGDASAPLAGIPYAIYSYAVGFSFGPSIRELREEASFVTVRRHAPAVAATILLFGAPLAMGLIRWARGDAARKLWLLALLMPLLLAFLAATRNVKVFNPRYASAALPAFVILIAEGLFALGIRRAGGAFLASILLVSGISIAQLRTDKRYWKEDARATAALLRENVREGDLIFMVGVWDPITRYYWTELRDHPSIRRYSPPFRVDPNATPDEADRALSAIGGARRTFVVFYRDDFMDPRGLWEAFLHERFDVGRRWDFPGSRVWEIAGEKRP